MTGKDDRQGCNDVGGGCVASPPGYFVTLELGDHRRHAIPLSYLTLRYLVYPRSHAVSILGNRLGNGSPSNASVCRRPNAGRTVDKSVPRGPNQATHGAFVATVADPCIRSSVIQGSLEKRLLSVVITIASCRGKRSYV